jgi:glycosyltransferase involved in cell wall biosynthesis
MPSGRKAMNSTAEQPLVSVVIPTCNRARMVVRAIASVLDQTYSNIECIVVDDASTDATGEAVARLADPRLRYLRNEINAGAPASRNRGIRQAAGQYVALLDDDDTWLPGKIEKQIAVFGQAPEKVGLVYTGFYFVAARSEQTVATVLPAKRGDVYDQMLESCILGSPTPLIKKECFEQAGLFDETLPSCQDWDMWLRIAKKYEFDFVPEALARHYVHGSQVSTSLASKIASRTTILNKHEHDIKKTSRIYSAHLRRLAILHWLAGNRGRARRLIAEALVARPLQLSGYVHAVLSCVPGVHLKILKKYFITTIDDITFYY